VLIAQELMAAMVDNDMFSVEFIKQNVLVWPGGNEP
jgi:hypothetical protein